jgi:hypothetical protein
VRNAGVPSSCSGLADDDPDVLRRAASGVADEWADQRADALLLDAAALARSTTRRAGSAFTR